MYLALAPDQGGTTFGPFPQGATLGSDARQCHVVLPAAMGVLPVHAWVVPAGDRAWSVVPADQDAVVYVGRGAMSPSVIRGPTQVNDGDTIVLVNPEGPRFTLSAGHQPAPRPHRLGGRRMPTAQDFADEIKRQVGVTAMSSGPFREVANAFYRFRSGAFLQPRYIIAGVIGLAAAATAGCAGIWAMLHHLLW